MAIWIITSVAVFVFAVLIISQRRPIIKNFVPIKINRASQFGSGVFLLISQTQTTQFVFIKNIGFRLFVDDSFADFPLSNCSHYRVLSSELKLSGSDIHARISTSSVEIFCKEKLGFSYDFDKPNFAYSIDTSRQEIALGKDKNFKIKLLGFSRLSITPTKDGKLRITGEIEHWAKAQFCEKCRVASREEVRKFKQQNFGVLDIDKWQFVPNFCATKLNALQRQNLSEKFDLSNRKVELPQRLDFEEVLPHFDFSLGKSAYLNIEKLGFGKVVRSKKRGNAAILTDLLSAVCYQFAADKDFECRIVCLWGINYLNLYGFTGEVKFCVSPLCNLVKRKEFCDLSLLSNIYKDKEEVGLPRILEQLNLSVLHGFWVDVRAIVSNINYKFLPSNTQFLLANLLLSYITTFDFLKLLNSYKFCNLLLRGLCYAMEIEGERSVCYCKKILPLIKSERAHQRISLHIVNQKIKNSNYDEYALSQILGITLKGNELTLHPIKTLKINTYVVIRGKKIILSISPNWSMVKINNLGLGNIYTFDIDKLDDNALITFD